MTSSSYPFLKLDRRLKISLIQKLETKKAIPDYSLLTVLYYGETEEPEIIYVDETTNAIGTKIIEALQKGEQYIFVISLVTISQ